MVNAENGPPSFADMGPNPPYSINTAGVVFGGSFTSDSPVPEASTNVSFGLLLVLGGLAVAAVKKHSARKAS